MDTLLITHWRDKICTVLYSEERPQQITLESPKRPSRLNNIYIGKVQKIVPGIQAAFVDIAPGEAGYYSLAENKSHHFVSSPRKEIKPGDELVVQVVRDAVKTKAPVLSANLSLPGRYCVVTDGSGDIGISAKITDAERRETLRRILSEEMDPSLGVVIRTNAASAPDAAILREYRALKRRYERLRDTWSSRTCYSLLYESPPSFVEGLRDMPGEGERKIITDDPQIYESIRAYLAESGSLPSDRADSGSEGRQAVQLVLYQDPQLPLNKLYSLDTVMERALEKKVWLKSGGYLVIEPTEAMVVIDVNSGKYSAKKQQRETIFRINREAAEEIARQLRLRNLSGIILVDFIDMDDPEDREALLRFLGGILKEDPVKTILVDMTPLGLVEITRKKVRKPLYEQQA